MDRKLYRDETRKVIGGVCAGLADYFNIDVSIVRLVFLLTLILKGGGVLIYIILWVVLPKKDYHFNPVNPGNPVPPFNPMTPPPFVDYTVPQGGMPQPDPQIFHQQPKQRSTGALMAGIILLAVGSFFILEDFDLIPDWDFAHFWPVILIILGIVVMFTGKKQPWEHKDWQKNDTNTTENNPPTI